ncbi:MAG: Nif3-like dinuclear metal center hexameric protein [Clostridia bacterium]|nr:Nif3-like dinuclear metal center hexameric protein [Clostridia bacterium]
MAKICDIDKVISYFAPKEISESWDNDGVMICGNYNKNIKKAAVMLEIRDKGVDFAVKNGVKLIVTHHPMIFEPLKSIAGKDYELFKKLADNDISVISYHTRMDSAEKGVNQCLAELFELKDVKTFGGESGMLGRIGTLKKSMSQTDFAEYIKKKLNCGTIRASLFKNGNKKISKVAFVGGGGKSYYHDAYLAGADAYITSEITHNIFINAKELDMCLFDCGHYYTENIICSRFKEIINSNFKDVEVLTYDVKSPYVNI